LEFSQKKKAVPPKTTTMARAKKRRRKFFISDILTGRVGIQNKKAPSQAFATGLCKFLSL